MLEADHLLRAALATETLAAVLLAFHWIGDTWHHRAWPARTILLGVLGALIYVMAGQVKAFNLNIPFDWVSAIGLAAYTVLLAGVAWHTARERHDRRGR